MKEETITVETSDGRCPVHVFTPDDGAKHPAVIMYTDALGIRPASLGMGRRLATYGYVVLVPDLFYRVGAYGPLDPAEVLSAPGGFSSLGWLLASTDTHRAAADSGALLDYLAGRDDVEGSGVGLAGYCRGGTLAFTTAGTYPDRVAALATFHTSKLVTDDKLSPSLVAPAIRARTLIVGADEDPGYPPEMAREIDALLTEAGTEHTMEIYPGARHGFTQPDFPVYDKAAAERHWVAMRELFDAALPA